MKSFELVTLALLLSTIFIGLTAKQANSSPATIIVPDNFPTIQEAINQANTGDTIYVKKGTYSENIIVNRTVSLLGESNAETILDGLGSRICVNVKANNVTISGFTVRNCSYNAVGIWDYHNATVANNILTNSNIGVFIANGQNVTVANNTLTDDMCGVMCAGSCRFNIISHNVLTRCAHSIDVHVVIGYNVVEDNLIRSSSGIGIWISNAPKTRILRNSITGSGEDNMLIQYCPDSTICANEIVGGKWGIRIGSTETKFIYHNNFINSTHQAEAFANGTATWDNGWEGNYWSDYDGSDSNGDGIGDIPYTIDQNNKDRYPLMTPWNTSRSDSHNIAITNITITRIIIGGNLNIQINATAANGGDYKETFNVTIQANTATIAEFENVSLGYGELTTLSFIWNPAGFPAGNYTITAIACTVPGETDTADNSRSGYVAITTTLLGDVDGDGDVDILDLVHITAAYGTRNSQPPYRIYLDLNGDGTINLLDLVIASSHYGERQ